MIDRSQVEALVRAALEAESGRRAPGSVTPAAPVDATGALLLSSDRRNLAEPCDPRAMQAIRQATPARVAVGRSGTRYRTNTLLRFRADHAAAKDAVLSEVDDKLIERLGLVRLRSRARDKTEFLLRPDAGRALSDESRRVVETSLPRGARVLLLYGDGLSAEAINTHLEHFHSALVAALAARGIVAGGVAYVARSRVKVMDEICRISAAQACVFSCGERPGLGFADSLSSYYMYVNPGSVPTDADREVISNINPRGVVVDRAAGLLAEAIERVLRDRKSGVLLS